MNQQFNQRSSASMLATSHTPVRTGSNTFGFKSTRKPHSVRREILDWGSFRTKTRRKRWSFQLSFGKGGEASLQSTTCWPHFDRVRTADHHAATSSPRENFKLWRSRDTTASRALKHNDDVQWKSIEKHGQLWKTSHYIGKTKPILGWDMSHWKQSGPRCKSNNYLLCSDKMTVV